MKNVWSAVLAAALLFVAGSAESASRRPTKRSSGKRLEIRRIGGEERVFDCSTGKQVAVVETIPVEKKLFRWTSKESADYTVANGKFDARDRAYFRNQSPYGRGLYISLDSTDSSLYGTHQLVISPKRNIKVIRPTGPMSLQKEAQAELRQLGIDGLNTQNRTGTWFAIFNLSALGKVERGRGR